MSRRPGIGARYLETHASWHKAELRNYMEIDGVKTLLPRYYRDKLYSKSERAVMANKFQVESVVQYHKEVNRLRKFHSDPYFYYEERFRYNHDKPIRTNEVI